MSVLREEHEESQHPRGEHGRWAVKGGLGSQQHYCYMTREQCEMTGLSRLLCRWSRSVIQDQRSRAPASIRSIGAPLGSNAEGKSSSVKAKSFRASDR
jgi:hypothetical protein